MDTLIDTIKSENFFYYKFCLEKNIYPDSGAPHVDHVGVETDEYVDDNFEIFLTELRNLKI